MTRHLNRWLRRLGAPGVLGIGLLLAAGGFWATALKPAQEEIVAQRQALERLQSRQPFQPVSAAASRAEELARFYRLFPPSERLTDETERLHRLARRAGLELAQGEYRLERRAGGLWAYRINLPVRGSYPQLRDFIAATLKDMPVASVEALRFERKRAAETELEAQVRITLFVRPSEE